MPWWSTGGWGWTKSRRKASPTCGRFGTAARLRGSSTRRPMGWRSRMQGECCGVGTPLPTPRDWSASSPGTGPTPSGARPSSSTRERRSTWPGWPRAMRRVCSRRTRRSPPARRAPPWSACAARTLVFPDDAHDHALQHHVALVHADRGHGWVGRLQADPPAGLAIVLLDGGVVTVHQRDHRLPVLGLVALVHDDVVTVLDVLVDHRGAADLEHIAAAAPGQFGGSGLALGGHDLDRPALVVGAADVPLALEVGEVLVHRRQRGEAETTRDLLEAGGVAGIGDVALQIREDLVLATRERHRVSRKLPEG